jgi:soluble lytic murein transglycosylase
MQLQMLRNRGLVRTMEKKMKTGLPGLLVSVFTVFTFFIVPSLSADIYVYRDSNGILHFSNAPNSTKYRPYMSESYPNPLSVLTDVDYDDVITEAANENDLPFHLLKALIHVESYFDPYAVSKKGALGLMQIMPENLETLDIDHPFDPRENVMGGASYLKNMLKRFDGKLELALAAYNAGPSAVEKYSAIPPYRETQEYVKKVLQLFKRYKSI